MSPQPPASTGKPSRTTVTWQPSPLPLESLDPLESAPLESPLDGAPLGSWLPDAPLEGCPLLGVSLDAPDEGAPEDGAPLETSPLDGALLEGPAEETPEALCESLSEGALSLGWPLEGPWLEPGPPDEVLSEG